MARFQVFLVGSSTPLDVDLAATDVIQLNAIASSVRFLNGHIAEPDGDGICPGVLIPTCRLQLVVEHSA